MRPTILPFVLCACGSVGGLTLEPAEPTSADDITARIDGDADADLAWWRDGELTDHTGTVLPHTLTHRGEIWAVSERDVAAGPRDEVLVRNAPPHIQFTGEHTVFADLPMGVAVKVTDADLDALDVTFTWRHGDTVFTPDVPSLRAKRTERGQDWTLTVSADDRFASVSDTWEITVVNGPPQIQGLRLTPEPVIAGSTVVAELEVIDRDDDPLVTTYVWSVDDTLVQQGERASLTADFTRGQVVSVSVTVDDGFDTVTQTASATVGNAPPTIPQPQVVPSVLSETSTASCVHGSPADADDDTVTVSTAWFVNGRRAGVTPTLSGNRFNRESLVQCAADLDDGSGTITTVLSEPVQVQNTAPVWSNPVIEPPLPTAATDLTVSTTGLTDVDDDVPMPAVIWWVNGQQVLERNTLPADHIQRGDRVYAEVNASDGAAWAGTSQTDEVVIGNAAPELSNVTLWPPIAHPQSVLTAAAIAEDADGDAVTLSWQWRANGVLIDHDAPTLDVDGFAVGTTFEATALATDGTDDAIPVHTSSVTVVATPEDALWMNLTPASPLHRDELRCDVWGDKAVVGDVYQHWRRNGQPAGSSVTIPWRFTSVGDTWTCIAEWPGNLVLTQSVTIAQGPPGGNVLLVIADDLGVDKVGGYERHPTPANTPVVDSLIAQGTRFDNAFAYPSCSPARAALLTGRYGRRTGIGRTINIDDDDYVLNPAELGIPEVLKRSPVYDYSAGAVGKWHIGSYLAPEGLFHPYAFGFDTFQILMGNLGAELLSDEGTPRSYFWWEQNLNGALTNESTYITTAQVDAAIAQTQTLPEPWFVWLAFTAPHTPTHKPPAELHTNASLQNNSPAVDKYDAAVEAMDTELGRLLDSLSPEVRADTTIIFLGDNGTPGYATTAPFDKNRAKTTVYEGGTHVPLVITGPHVQHPGSQVPALVHVVDILPTLADIAGVDLSTIYGTGAPGNQGPLDGSSLMPFLADPATPGPDTVYTERFGPNGGRSPHPSEVASVRDDRWRYILDDAGAEALHDLVPQDYHHDGDNLLDGSLSSEAQQAYNRLSTAFRARLDAFRATGAP